MTQPKITKDLHEAKVFAKERARTASPALLRNPKTSRQLLSRSDSEIVSELDTRESPLRVGWPNLPPLPVKTFEAFPETRPPILPNKDAHIQKVETILRVGRIESGDVDIVFRVPESDLVSPGAGNRRSEVKLPEEEYLTMLVTLDLNTYKEKVKSALLQVRRELKTHKETSGLLIEFLDHRCGISGFPNADFTMQDGEVTAVWESAAFQADFKKFLVDEKVATIHCMNMYPVSDDSFEPTIVIGLYNASDLTWWEEALPSLRKWLQSVEVFAKYNVRVAVHIIQYVSGW